MKKIIILFAIMLSNYNAKAQTQNDVVGYYKLRGGSHYLKPDGTFVIIGYATLITGKWTLKEHGEVQFIPDAPKESFQVYGRHTPELKENSKFMLSNGLHEEETFMHIGKLSAVKPKLQRVYVKGHHCIKFPEVYTTTKKADTISFTSLPYSNSENKEYKPKIYTFNNIENFNDFIVYHFEDKDNYHPFSYLYKDGGLYYSKHFGEKLDLNEELSKSEFSQISGIDFAPNLVLYTPKYKSYDADIENEEFKLNYTLDEKRNAYINKLNYVAGEENTADYDYNNTNLLYIYKKINTFITTQKSFLIEEKSIFKDHCKE
ncbi:hypothetical protein OIU80_15100 [Flavobacterium sp. LS1R47]|uniref:DKNYY family protein n=1 Tax=Flavobacterium frigoritolerans TaxID=2987686 RepID=A0A9X3C256_9FLAO|nr:hypothetical protein [Flavobacterium frigoritolerans]MCV9933611.1 hypothetical protein [Flavobacterium frigoritolerans]